MEGYKKSLIFLLFLSIAAFLLSLCIPAIAPEYVSADELIFHDFTDLSDFTLNGVTQQIAKDKKRGSALRLTNSLNQSGSAFLSQPVYITADASFSTHFRFRITEPQGVFHNDEQGADGIVFVVQTQANNVGGTGSSIGFGGIRNSIGVEFDTWHNFFDIDGNHVGINLNGNARSVVAEPVDTRLNNGKVWNAWIDYNGQTDMLEVRISRNDARPSAALISHQIDLVKILGKTEVFVGFTSGTGAGGNTHDIISWNFRGYYLPIGSHEGSIRVVEDKNRPVITPPSQIELILDASGSMRGKVKSGEQKITIAKNVLSSIIHNLPEDLEVALRVYGHHLPKDPKRESCNDTELIVPFGTNNRETLIKAIDNISPKGQTPIGRSLLMLSEDFKETSGAKLVILVSDGIETCSTNKNDKEYPISVIKMLQEKGFQFRVNIVGFEIGESQTREFLQTLAQTSGGHYYDAKGTKQLENSIDKAMNTTYSVLDAQGIAVGQGLIDSDPVLVPEGTYTVVIEMDPPLEISNVKVNKRDLVLIRLHNDRGKIATDYKVIKATTN